MDNRFIFFDRKRKIINAIITMEEYESLKYQLAPKSDLEIVRFSEEKKKEYMERG